MRLLMRFPCTAHHFGCIPPLLRDGGSVCLLPLWLASLPCLHWPALHVLADGVLICHLAVVQPVCSHQSVLCLSSALDCVQHA